MAFSRNSMIAAIAGSVSLAILTGCPQAQNPVGTPSVSPSTPAASPSTPAASPSTPAASPSGSVDPSAAPSVVPSSSPLVATTVNGTVYDEEGAPVSAAKIRIESLNPSNPFDTTVDVTNGAYVANSVPAGVQVRITASREGWTSRSRVTTLLPIGEGRRNEVNFGGASDTEDPSGPAYFISDFPEVAMVEPADDAANVNPATVSVKLTLSEPLDSTNQRRLANAIRVLPAERQADPLTPQATTAYLQEEDQASFVSGTPYTSSPTTIYEIGEDSTFLGDDDTQAEVTWDSTGTVATLTFAAPLLAGEDENFEYAVALFSDGQEIEDNANNQLGTDDSGVLNSDPANNELIYFAFKEPSLAVPTGTSTPGDADTRWRLTHENFSLFEVAEDETEPTLAGVNVTTLTGRTRISLTFSEPMAAFGGGSAGIYGNNTLNNSINDGTEEAADLAMYTFAVGENAGDLDDTDLDGDSPASFEVSTNEAVGGIGNTSAERETEFVLVPDAGATVSVAVNPDDPKVLRIEVTNQTLFANDVNAIKARVEGISDPAGNTITESQADANEKVGTI